MARNKSFVKLEGTLDDLTFYQKDGENLVKKKSSVSKNRIMNDSAYRRTRENMREFGGAARVGKSFRSAFAGIIKTMGDTYVGSRINGIMKRINNFGVGIRGQREFELVTYGEMLRNFEFNEVLPLNSQFFAPFSSPSINASRDQVVWTIPDFSTDSFVRSPEGATHFRLVLAAGYVSDFTFSMALNSYVPVDEDVNGLGGVMYSGDIPLNGMVGAVTTLTLDLNSFGVIPATSALFVGIGIIFYQETNGDLYELAQGNAMKVASVG
ncbi:MAG: hypothetical protein ACTIJ9_12330 [Aequorivita sp.]